MPWPDIFFKAKTPPQRNKPALTPLSEALRAKTEAPVPKPDPVAQAMAEADPIQALSRSGGVKLTKRDRTEPRPEIAPPVAATAPLPSQTSSLASPSPTTVPAAFPVPVTTGSVLQLEKTHSAPKPELPDLDITPLEKGARQDKANEPVAPDSPAKTAETGSTAQETVAPKSENKPEFPIPDTLPSPESKADPTPKSPPVVGAAKPDPAAADKPLAATSSPSEKREFHLTNGERILGRILSETPDAIYLEHATLGVLTLPRTQIAKRLVEIILINGDRIVGDIVAESPECLFVRHASLGMLTVPHSQRSTRVVEAILKDGDRILGEVQAETDTFTVIRSASLGTITVQHSQVAMLNRKVEQIQLKALPPTVPEIKDKPASS